jgi:hypothetical protein
MAMYAPFFSAAKPLWRVVSGFRQTIPVPAGAFIQTRYIELNDSERHHYKDQPYQKREDGNELI